VSSSRLFRNRYRVPSARLPGWDYRWAGVYSVTICTHNRDRCLGDVVEGEVELSPLGEVTAEEWQQIPGSFARVSLDEWIIMPDHLHGILVFQPPRGPKGPALGTVVGQFKSAVTRRIRWDLKRREFAWQERFHDTIVRDEAALEKIRAYIRDNPARWKP
jgi:putative transposase